MDFASYLGRARAFDTTGLTPDAARKLGRLFDRGVALSEVTARWTTELGGHGEGVYRLAREIWYEHRQWRQAVQAVTGRRVAAGQVVLPDEVVQRTWDEDELRVIEGGAEQLMALRTRSHGTWTDALLAVADARAAALSAALSSGFTRLEPDGDEVPAREVRADAWIAATHAQVEGWPQLRALDSGVEAATRALVATLSRLDESLDAEAFAQRLVVDDLESTVRRAMYRRAIIALAAAVPGRVAKRLAARPATPSRALGLYVGAPGSTSAAALVSRDGGAPKTHVAEPVDGPVSALAFLMEHARRGDAWVFPETALDPEGLAAALDALPDDAGLLRVPADGLPDAAPGPAGTPAAARAAVALARRALEPERAWRALPPDAGWFLPPGVCLSKSDTERLAERVSEALAAAPTAAPERSSSRSAPPAERGRRAETTPRSRQSVSGTAERPNPGLERLSDLEAGMRLRGHVASINRYGAFVDVGLPKEGLVPLQALTGGSGASASDVVVNGQSVEVRVLSVDAGRGRFELALEAVHDEIRPPPGRQRSGGGRGKPNGQRSGRPRSGGSSRRGRG
ncbi:MAG: S1 RNA-binding domain-containing protein [Myxococcota bacterium]